MNSVYSLTSGINASFICLVVISLVNLHSGQITPTNDEEIKPVGGICPGKDTCSLPRDESADNLLQYTCECKPSCRKYGTCCKDSPNHRFLTHKSKKRSGFPYNQDCHSLFGTTAAIFAETKCKESWEGDDEVKSICERDIEDFKDPIAVLPVADPITLRSYKNYFCAICNDDVHDLVFWDIRIEKFESSPNSSKDKETFMQDLTYNITRGQWGVITSKSRRAKHMFISNETFEDTLITEDVFEPVSIAFDEPPRMKGKLQRCVPGLISDCHPEWKDAEVRHMCHSYMSMIYSALNTSDIQPLKRFRNEHCARCNFAGGTTNLFCEKVQIKTTTRGPPLSFSLLLDINPSDGNRVGEISRCKSGELYDPFFKKCRALICVKPGYKVTNGKCEPS